MLFPGQSDPPRTRDSGGFDRIGGRYEIEDVVGRGGMGAVYRVLDQRTGKRLALKRLHVKNRKDEALAHFEREFYVLAQLRHPRIIAVHEYGVDAFSAWYTMELLSGADMRTLAPLPWTLVCRYLREVATSLALLHARRLVHRDVTPQNVRVGQDGHCKLIDFGALADFGLSGVVVGTPPCVPPEAVDGKPIDQRVDLYALGCLGYWMLTGRHAYPATDPRQLRAFWARTLSPPSVGRPTQGEGGVPLPEIPPALDALVMKLLALDPMARPSSAGAVIDQLDVITREALSISQRPPRFSSAPEDTSLAESYVQSAPLCGRKHELDPLKPALDRTRRGRGTSLILEGPAGVGRTRLLADVALRTRLAGCVTLQVDAAAHGQSLAAMRALAQQLTGHEPEPETTHQQLHSLFFEAARKRPLALIVDDVHRMDEASLRVLGTLAHDARRTQLLIVSALRTSDEAVSDTGIAALRTCSSSRTLGDLSEGAVQQWLSSILGDAPTLGRLASYLHTRSNGRAASVAAMLRALIDRGELRYREGVWVLPAEPAQIALPERPDEAALERLYALPSHARELAEALCMHRTSFSNGLCALIGGERADAATDVLVQSGMWLRGSEGFRFASEALRERLIAGIDGPRAAQLHSQLAAAILALPGKQGRACTPDEELTAAVHMLEARDVAGVSLAVHAAIVIWERATGLAGVMRLLERALELSRPLGISATGRLALLASLGLGAYTVDHRLGRYEAEIFEALDTVSGLDIARKLDAMFARVHKSLGALGALIGIGFGAVRYYLRPRGKTPDDPRPTSIRTAIKLGVAALVANSGRAAISLDRAGAMRVVEHLKPLRVLGMNDSGGFSLAYCRGLAMVTEDRYERTYQYWLDLERRIATPGSLTDVQGEQRQLWEAGVSYVLGLFEGFRGDMRALTRAERLERSQNGLHRMIATQIRLQYHGFRGETEPVRKAYERMEACAIEVGSSWQVEAWSAIAINLFGAFWHDIILIKRTLRETQRMASELPSLKRYATTSEAVYLMRRGQPRDAADLYEPLLAAEQPMSRIGWSVSSGLLAEAYNQLGMHQEAKALCERVFATVSLEDRPYYAMRIAVEVPYGVALAALGDYEKGRAHLLGLLECYAPAASPAALGTVHEALARIELSLLDKNQGDRKRFTEHVKQVEKHFTTLGNPALIARFQALTDVAGQGGGILTKVALTRELRAFEAALEPILDRLTGARAILAWLMRSCEGYEGYLFVRRDELSVVDSETLQPDEPIELIAATSDKEPGDEVFRSVAEALEALGGSGDTTNFGTSAATRTRRDGSSTHLYLLSYLDADQFRAEGALVLLGRAPTAPPVRYELLQAAAFQLRRLSRDDVA